MKTLKGIKVKMILVAFFAMSFCYSLAQDEKSAQLELKDPNAIEEIILGVPKITEKNIFLITETVPKIKGLTYVSFCDAHKLLLLKYDKTVFSKPEMVIRAFEQQKIVIPMLIKTGTFEDVNQMCMSKESE
jgi:hypothetical protein